MAAQQQPPQPMGSTNVIFRTETRFDPSYIKTLPGILKIVAIILNLLGFICIQSSSFWSNGRGVYFNVVAQLALWFTVVFLLLYLFHVIEKYHNIKWLQIEMVGCAVITLLYLIASSIAVAFGAASYSAAGFFGYLCMVLYGAQAFLRARALQAGQLPQGARLPAKPPHLATPPALP